MKKLVFLIVLMFGFTFCLFGQHTNSSLPKVNPGKRVTDYVTGSDSIHYIYLTSFDTLASVAIKKQVLSTGHVSWWLDSMFYDSQDRLIAKHTYQKDSIGNYKIRFKHSTDYDDLTHSQIRVGEAYSITGVLQSLNKVVKTYYSAEKLKQESSYYWNSDSSRWILTQYRHYDEYGRIIDHTLLDFLRYTYEYTADGILLTEKIYTWEDNINQFVTYNKTVNEVIDGKIIVSDSYRRNYGSGIWHHVGRKLYTYDADGLKEKEINQKNYLGVLTNIDKYEYLYDAQSRLKERLYSKWVDTLGFVKSEKIEYLFNDQLRYQAEIFTSWDVPSMTWNPKAKKIDYFAEDNSLDSTYRVGINNAGEEYRIIKRVQFNSDKTILEITDTVWDGDTNSWFTKTNQRWYFEDYDRKPIEKEPFVISVFPNPASDYIYLGKGTIPDVEAYIYSASGRLMVAQKLLQTNRIYVGDWPTGVYYYVLVHNHQVLSGSIFKL